DLLLEARIEYRREHGTLKQQIEGGVGKVHRPRAVTDERHVRRQPHPGLLDALGGEIDPRQIRGLGAVADELTEPGAVAAAHVKDSPGFELAITLALEQPQNFPFKALRHEELPRV